jgi:hypothetical protein
MAKAKKSKQAAENAEVLDSATVNTNTVAPVEVTSIQINKEVLTAEQTKRLADLEEAFDSCKKKFKEGLAILHSICEEKLYRGTHATFEEYCRQRWGITARHANRLMLADAVVENIKSDQLVSNVPAAIPKNEAQSRPLQGLTPEKQVEAARIVAKKPGKRTAKHFKDAANQVSGKAIGDEPEEDTDVNADEPEDKVHIQSYLPSTDAIPNTSSKTEEEDYDQLLEYVDAAQSLARKTPGCGEVAKQLGEIAKKVQQIKAKGTR